MSAWDERFREGNYPLEPDPDPFLERMIEAIPDGRALDVAVGTGRNTLFLAEEGYEVDALDKSRVGLEIARENARDRGVNHRCAWIHADAFEFVYPSRRYDLITIRAFQILERLPDIKGALKPGGVLYYQPHVRTEESLDYGPSERHRVGVNELLRACLDLTVLHYREFTTGEMDHRGAYAQILARKTSGHTQSHPDRSLWDG